MRSLAVRTTRSKVILLAVAGPSLVASRCGAAHAAGASTVAKPTVVVGHLANPRHLVVDSRGDLYVAEAGRGAIDTKTAPFIKTKNPETGQDTTFYYGKTSAILRIRDGKTKRVVSGLPSVAEASGENAGGVSDLTVPIDGSALGVVNLGADPRKKEAALPKPAVPLAGHLLRLDTRNNRFRVGVDVSAFEVTAKNPDRKDPGSAYDSNPYALASGRDRYPVVVADAGGNDLLSVDARGRIRLLALFHARLFDPPPGLGLPAGKKVPVQSVPNSVTRGPDGAWYVGELTGFPFLKGKARVWKVVPGRTPRVVASGFTNIIDVAFDRSGRLLVLEIARTGLLDPKATGALWRVERNGKKTLVTSELTAPGGVVVGRDGYAYVTNKSISPTAGEVVRVKLPR